MNSKCSAYRTPKGYFACPQGKYDMKNRKLLRFRFFCSFEAVCFCLGGSVVVPLELHDLAGLGVHVVLILHAALVEPDLVDLSAILVVHLDPLHEIDLFLLEARVLQRLCQRLVLGERAAGDVLQHFVVELVDISHCYNLFFFYSCFLPFGCFFVFLLFTLTA